MTDLERFLERDVEGYLFWDLRAMQRQIALPGEPGGGLGFPLLMATFSGIELFGALLSPTAFSVKSGAGYGYFEAYWCSFLYPNLKPPAAEINVAYRLARNGIAHNFMLKGPVGIVKGQSSFHLTHDSGGTFYIDSSQLATDLINSYHASVKPHLSAPNARVDPALMAARLGEILAAYESQANSLLPNHGAAGAVGIGTPSPGQPSGASGPTGPISSSLGGSQP